MLVIHNPTSLATFQQPSDLRYYTVYVYQPVRLFQPAAIIPSVGASAVRSFVALGVPSDEPILTVYVDATNDGT